MCCLLSDVPLQFLHFGLKDGAVLRAIVGPLLGSKRFEFVFEERVLALQIGLRAFLAQRAELLRESPNGESEALRRSLGEGFEGHRKLNAFEVDVIVEDNEALCRLLRGDAAAALSVLRVL